MSEGAEGPQPGQDVAIAEAPADDLGSFLKDQAALETTRVALDAEVNPPAAPIEEAATPVEDAAAQKEAEAAQKEAEAAAENARQVAVDGKLKELVGREDLKGFLQKGNRDAVLTWNTDPTTGEKTYPQAILTRDGKVDVQFGNDAYAESRVTYALAQVDASGKYVDADGQENYVRPQATIDGIKPTGEKFIATRPEFAKGGMFVAENTSGTTIKGTPLAELRLGDRQPWEKTAAETPDSIQATLIKDVKEPALIPPVRSSV